MSPKNFYDAREQAVKDVDPPPPADIVTPRRIVEFPRRVGLPPGAGIPSLENTCAGCWIALAMHWNAEGAWIGCYGAIEHSAALLQKTTVPDLEARILDHCVLAACDKFAQFLYEDADTDPDQRPDLHMLQVREVRFIRKLVKGTLAIARQCAKHGAPPVTHKATRQALDSAEGA